jgi:hypothetical protein
VRIAFVAALCALYVMPAPAQKSTEGAARDCERFAVIKLKRYDPAFKRRGRAIAA